ncbi:MAG: hypothetical protein GY777_09010 [Candidatus Brocadiaceae bacterium]|nr:hypothetical protein [Candidatus Brocadiaceae bacterium]
MIPLKFEVKVVPGSYEWKKQMAQLGEAMKDSMVRHVFFTHGTFAGNDPIGINRLLENIEETTGKQIFRTSILRKFTKDAINRLTKDLGNFTEGYKDSFHNAVSNNINCDLFVWSGENHHTARLIGAVELSQKLSDTIRQFNYVKNERIILMGHSHAGQIFALLATLLENGDKANELYDIIDIMSGFDVNTLRDNLAEIKNVCLDFVTFGTPVRYRWGKYHNYRLINIINDRNNNVKIDGILRTRDGDYVQQWATEGTDVKSASFSENNERLDDVLENRGRISASEFLEKLKDHTRKFPLYYDSTEAHQTFLVDYQDQDDKSTMDKLLEFDSIPHCVKTLFGHGIYTRKETMLFNAYLIANNLYL